MKTYMNVKSYYDTEKWIIVRSNAKKTQIKNVRTQELKLVDTNKFLRDYIEC